MHESKVRTHTCPFLGIFGRERIGTGSDGPSSVCRDKSPTPRSSRKLAEAVRLAVGRDVPGFLKGGGAGCGVVKAV
jgi:hypothetical protein